MGSEDSIITLNHSVLKSVLLVSIFLILTPVALATSSFALITMAAGNQKRPDVKGMTTNLIESPKSGVQVFASLPDTAPEVSIETKASDAREEIIKQYLQKFSSPLALHAEKIIETSDKYGLDFRLITAIAQKESNLCKLIPPNSHNCWGWGIHSRGTLGFDSYDEAIETVSKGIKEEYIDKGFVTLEEIMSKYTPLSPGTWAEGVAAFMGEME